MRTATWGACFLTATPTSLAARAGLILNSVFFYTCTCNTWLFEASGSLFNQVTVMQNTSRLRLMYRCLSRKKLSFFCWQTGFWSFFFFEKESRDFEPTCLSTVKAWPYFVSSCWRVWTALTFQIELILTQLLLLHNTQRTAATRRHPCNQIGGIWPVHLKNVSACFKA